jgi:hypothetical protein
MINLLPVRCLIGARPADRTAATQRTAESHDRRELFESA